jgi:hypothetical protein
MKTFTAVLEILFICCTGLVYSQQQVDLARILQEQQMKAVNRTLTLYGDGEGAVEMNAARGDGLGIIEDIAFETGTIEVELLGENSPGRSFIGIAFNIEDAETYEAVYFRPFNFVATAQINRDHMVQYIFHPDFTWSRLRQEQTGEFENEIPSPPDPDDWFKATIEVTDSIVKVYVEGIALPVLEVERLTATKSGKIGLWVGNGSSGRFRNLVLL